MVITQDLIRNNPRSGGNTGLNPGPSRGPNANTAGRPYGQVAGATH